jgi:hypothetical protein
VFFDGLQYSPNWVSLLVCFYLQWSYMAFDAFKEWYLRYSNLREIVCVHNKSIGICWCWC